MTQANWHTLPAGPALRRIVAERLGWHMRKTLVGAGGIEYDYLIYNNDDHIVYQRELTRVDLQDEQAAVDQTWHEAMSDDACPRWDEELDEALDLIYSMERKIWHEDDWVCAWVKSSGFEASGPTEPLAVVRAWLAATQDDPAFSH